MKRFIFWLLGIKTCNRCGRLTTNWWAGVCDECIKQLTNNKGLNNVTE